MQRLKYYMYTTFTTKTLKTRVIKTFLLPDSQLTVDCDMSKL